MPAWPGGHCPDCGDFMPPNLVTCQTCRALLNTDLQQNIVEIPEFIPLRELPEDYQSLGEFQLESDSRVQIQMQVFTVAPKGVFVRCPGCQEELKVPQQYAHSQVKCNFCQSHFMMDSETRTEQIVACYADCPHCQKRIRSRSKYTNQKVRCEHCEGELCIKFEP